MFELDGMSLLNELLISSIGKEDKRTAQILKIFRKYGVDVLKGMAMLMEITAMFENGEEE